MIINVDNSCNVNIISKPVNIVVFRKQKIEIRVFSREYRILFFVSRRGEKHEAISINRVNYYRQNEGERANGEN